MKVVSLFEDAIGLSGGIFQGFSRLSANSTQNIKVFAMRVVVIFLLNTQ